MISSHYGQFGYWSGLGDIGDLGAARKRRRGKRSFTRMSQRNQQNQQNQQQQQQQQSEDSGGGGGGGGYEEEETPLSDGLSAEQLQALAALMQSKKSRHRRRSAGGYGYFGRGGGGGGRGRGSRSYHYHLQQLALQQSQQQPYQRDQQQPLQSGDASEDDIIAKVLEKLKASGEGVAGFFGDVFDGALGLAGQALGAVFGTAARLAGWAGLGDGFGLFSVLRTSATAPWVSPAPYAGLGHSEVETAALDQRRRGISLFLHNAFAELGGGNPAAGQRRLAEAGAYGPDVVIAIQEYLAARGQSPAALQRRLRALRLEYGRARQRGNVAAATRLYYQINAIEARLGGYGKPWEAGPGGPMDTHVGMSVDSDVSIGTSGIPWKPILIGAGVISVIAVLANSKKGRKSSAPAAA